jgi:nucleoid-associated protein YgaU
VRASKILTAASVMAAGLCAAWPFRQPAGNLPSPLPVSMPLELTLRSLDVPLTAAGASDQSPASDLTPAARAATIASRGQGNSSLEQFAPPPELPVSFHADMEPATSPLARLDDRALPAGSQGERSSGVRTYVLRDGDTLEKLAERFLGSRLRAAEIYDANRPKLTRPDLLPVGTAITIPRRLPATDSPELAER